MSCYLISSSISLFSSIAHCHLSSARHVVDTPAIRDKMTSRLVECFGATSTLSLLVLASTVIISTALFSVFRRQSLPLTAPQLTSDNLPILGALSFFSKRWDLHQHATASSNTGQFSYYVGNTPVIGLRGDSGRKTFLESRKLNLGAGYKRLFAAGPAQSPDEESEDNPKGFDTYFMKRLAYLVKNEQLAKRMPHLLNDSRIFVDDLATKLDKETGVGLMDPFQDIYKLVFQLTVRATGCNDIANDPELLAQVLGYYEATEHATSSAAIIFPWLPTFGKLRRNYACFKLYRIIKRITDDRNWTGKRVEDPLQHLVDSGDTDLNMTMFMISVFFAGILNSGVNAAAVLCYLATSSQWQNHCIDEIRAMADKHTTHPDSDTASLLDKLRFVPLSAWETSLPRLDLCFRDSIRLQLSGTGFRRNTSKHAVQIGGEGDGPGEIIPPGAYATWHFKELHFDPTIYPDPYTWDPARYLPDRAEDKKVPYAWCGFGGGRHPCAGMRFARLEQNIIIAMFLARFELLALTDSHSNFDGPGSPFGGKRILSTLPPPDMNEFSAVRSRVPVRVHYRLRDGGG